MGKIEKISAGMSAFAQSLASLAKVALLSRRPSVAVTAGKDEELVVLGNGPSLNDTVADHSDFLASRRLLAVNFAANTPLFRQLKPDYYVLADPHFFNPQGNPAVAALWDAIASADWRMTLMLAIAAGFKTVYVAGADHSWMKTISVDDDNHVVSIQPHFYKDSDNEHARVRKDYMNYPLHQIVYSFYVAFRSYHTLQAYALSRGVNIYNITPGSFIDAFPRKKIR